MVVVLAGLLSASCTIEDPPVAASPPGPVPTFDLDDRAKHDGLVTSVVQVQRPKGGPSLVPDDETEEWLGVRASVCVPHGAGSPADVGWLQFLARGSDGATYVGAADYASDWPTTQFPMSGTVKPGSCASGWVLIPVPKRAEVETLEITDAHGIPLTAWRLEPPPHRAHEDGGQG